MDTSTNSHHAPERELRDDGQVIDDRGRVSGSGSTAGTISRKAYIATMHCSLRNRGHGHGENRRYGRLPSRVLRPYLNLHVSVIRRRARIRTHCATDGAGAELGAGPAQQRPDQGSVRHRQAPRSRPAWRGSRRNPPGSCPGRCCRSTTPRCPRPDRRWPGPRPADQPVEPPTSRAPASSNRISVTRKKRRQVISLPPSCSSQKVSAR